MALKTPLMRRTSFLFLLAPTVSAGAFAQGTGTVASPVIKSGASVSVATGMAFEDGDEGFSHRADYRRAIGDNWRLSSFAFFNDRGGNGDVRYRRFAVEAMHQFASNKTGWNSALQVRGRIPDGNDGAGRLRVAWLNSWRPVAGPEVRLIGLASQEVGNDRREGAALETRAEATWKVTPSARLGAQMFNRYNTTENFGSFNTQRHSVGGVAKGALTETLSYRINALAGISEAAADFELRVRLRLKL